MGIFPVFWVKLFGDLSVKKPQVELKTLPIENEKEIPNDPDDVDHCHNSHGAALHYG